MTEKHQEVANKSLEILKTHNCRLEGALLVRETSCESSISVVPNVVAGEEEDAAKERADACMKAIDEVMSENKTRWAALCVLSNGMVRTHLELMDVEQAAW